jgi:hypothetical protein
MPPEVTRCPALKMVETPNGLEMSRPPARASLPSLYASLARKTSGHFAKLGGSAPSSC